MHEDDQTKIKRSLGIIYKSGDLLLHLLTDLLTFSKNQIGQQLMLEEKEFRLSDVSSQILHIFEKQAKEGSIQLRLVYEGPNESLETASGIPGQAGYGPCGTGRVRDMCLWGDQHRILQVIINLVNNSLYVNTDQIVSWHLLTGTENLLHQEALSLSASNASVNRMSTGHRAAAKAPHSRSNLGDPSNLRRHLQG